MDKELQELMKKSIQTTAEVKTIDGQKVFVISDSIEDRQGECISTDGWLLDNYKKNPVILWSHDYSEPTLGKGTNLRFRTIDGEKKLTFVPEFHKKTELSRLICDLVEEGYINATSVGFMPVDQEGQTYTKQELLEVSFVNVPANPRALALAMSKGYNTSMVNKVLDVKAQKSVIPYTKYPLAEEGASWDGPKEVAQAEVADLRRMCTWYDSENSDVKSAYKLPHHTATGYRTVWAGVRAAMGALMGARGGVDVPEGDKQGIYNHLKQHYAEFDKEAPELRSYNEIVDRYCEGKDTTDLVADTAKSINVMREDFQEYQKAVKEEIKTYKADFSNYKSLIQEEVENMKVNLKGVSEGINPGDEGLETRFKAIEDNQIKIMELLSSHDKSSDGDTGREPKSTKENRDLALKALNKAQEALNRVLKD